MLPALSGTACGNDPKSGTCSAPASPVYSGGSADAGLTCDKQVEMGVTISAGHSVGTQVTLPVCTSYWGGPAPVVCYCQSTTQGTNVTAGWNCPQ